jgi:hypothetical protein
MFVEMVVVQDAINLHKVKLLKIWKLWRGNLFRPLAMWTYRQPNLAIKLFWWIYFLSPRKRRTARTVLVIWDKRQEGPSLVYKVYTQLQSRSQFSNYRHKIQTKYKLLKTSVVHLLFPASVAHWFPWYHHSRQQCTKPISVTRSFRHEQVTICLDHQHHDNTYIQAT